MGQYDPKKPSAFNVVNITLVLVLGTIGYLGWFYLPHWWPVFRMTAVMNGIANDAYRELDNEKLLKKLLVESGRTSLRGLNEHNFKITREGYSPEEVAAKAKDDYARKLLEKRGKLIHIDFHYEVDAQWPLRSATKHLVFNRRITQNLETIQY